MTESARRHPDYVCLNVHGAFMESPSPKCHFFPGPTWESQPAVRNNIWAARTEPPPGWSRPGEVTAEKIDPFDASITRDNIPSDATGGPSDPKSFQKQQQHWGGFKNPLD
eukprot:m.114918 g.114918  ORF g.114918 m.114918 type:complete len:110 (+) comp17127_c0_seq5:1108-1437(+)